MSEPRRRRASIISSSSPTVTTPSAILRSLGYAQPSGSSRVTSWLPAMPGALWYATARSGASMARTPSVADSPYQSSGLPSREDVHERVGRHALEDAHSPIPFLRPSSLSIAGASRAATVRSSNTRVTEVRSSASITPWEMSATEGPGCSAPPVNISLGSWRRFMAAYVSAP